MTADDVRFYKSLGICPVCRTNRLAPGKNQCFDCLERSRAYSARKRANMTEDERKESNERIRAMKHELYARRKAEGVCTRCGKGPLYDGTTLCMECAIKRRRNEKPRSNRTETEAEKYDRLVRQAAYMRSCWTGQNGRVIDWLWRAIRSEARR